MKGSSLGCQTGSQWLEKGNSVQGQVLIPSLCGFLGAQSGYIAMKLSRKLVASAGSLSHLHPHP